MVQPNPFGGGGAAGVPGGNGAGSMHLVPPASAPTIVPGGFWRRLVASFVDVTILIVMQLPISLVVGIVAGVAKGANGKPTPEQTALNLIAWAFGVALGLVYHGVFYKKKGATPGKMLMGLKVVDAETGTHIGYGKTVLRELLGKWLAALILGIGYLMVAFRSDKRGLHDLLAGTQVIRK